MKLEFSCAVQRTTHGTEISTSKSNHHRIKFHESAQEEPEFRSSLPNRQIYAIMN